MPTEHLHQITGLEPERVGEPGRQAQDAVLAAPSLVKVPPTSTPTQCTGVFLAPRAAAPTQVGRVAQRVAENVHCRTRRGPREAAGDREPGAYSMWRQNSPTRHPGQRSGERRARSKRTKLWWKGEANRSDGWRSA